MRKIPNRIKESIESDPFYRLCCLADYLFPCKGKIEWHHAIIFKGRQLNEKFAIVPLCEGHHKKAGTRNIKNKVDWIVVNRATEGELVAISKAIDYLRVKRFLNSLYGCPQ